MCTAVSFGDRIFGRTLDYHKSFGERILITPRERVTIGEAKNRYSMIGVGVLQDNIPLYFDGMNEWGLFCAALNFSGFAHYGDLFGKKAGISSSHLLSFILGFSKSCEEVRSAMSNLGITDEGASPGLEPTELHWIVCDRRSCIVIEPTDGGVRIYDNPFGVLTNAPDFRFQSIRMADFASLSSGDLADNLTDGVAKKYSHGLGALGLPGDYSSTSRFVRSAFVRKNIKDISTFQSGAGENNSSRNTLISSFFHLMSSVSVPFGCSSGEGEMPMMTLYTVCADPEELNYYFTDYTNHRIRVVGLREEFFECKEILSLPIYSGEDVKRIN